MTTEAAPTLLHLDRGLPVLGRAQRQADLALVLALVVNHVGVVDACLEENLHELTSGNRISATSRRRLERVVRRELDRDLVCELAERNPLLRRA